MTKNEALNQYKKDKNLSRADLSRAYLSGADLSGAYLSWANLSWANLRWANLCGANLCGADLSGAYLSWADLSGADLSGADLSGANLCGAGLSGAYLSNTKGLYQIVPEVGAFDGFKKLRNGKICRLRIPENAGRVGGFTGRKCRAETALVIEGGGISSRGGIYTEGEIVTPDTWNNDPRIECSHGIHFFLTRREAEEY